VVAREIARIPLGSAPDTGLDEMSWPAVKVIGIPGDTQVAPEPFFGNPRNWPTFV